jgi:hypothetical protein
MKTYTMTMKVPEGNDEYWEGLDKLTKSEAKIELARCLRQVLSENGFFDVEIKMGKTL